MKNPDERLLFHLHHSGRKLSVALTGPGFRKVYFGYINDRLACMDVAKGAVLRRLIQIARTYPKHGFEPEVVRQRNSQ